MPKLKLIINFEGIPVTSNFNLLPILITNNIKITLIFLINFRIAKYFQSINKWHPYLKPTNNINIKLS